MEKTLSSEVSKEKVLHDDLTFCPELFSDIINPPLASQLSRLENALSVLSKNKKPDYMAVDKISKRSPNYHCDLCEDNLIYKVPPNSEVKFTQFSKLTYSDMKDALFLRESTKYQSHDKLMKLVYSEQDLFENFLSSLSSKFSLVKSKLPGPWYQHAQLKFGQAVMKTYGNSGHNFRLLSTHVLNVSVIPSASPSIEMYGQLLAYGSIFKIKLPKLGQLVKTDLGILHRPCIETRSAPGHAVEKPRQKLDNLIADSVSCSSKPPTANTLGDSSQPKENSTNNQDQIGNKGISQIHGGERLEGDSLEPNLSSEFNIYDTSTAEYPCTTDSSVGHVVVAEYSDDMEISDSSSSELTIEMKTATSDDAENNKSETVSEAYIPEQLVDEMETSTSDDAENNKSETVSEAHIHAQLVDKMDVATSDDTENKKSEIVSEAHIHAQLADKMDVPTSDDAENNKSETVSNAHVPEELADKMETVISDDTANDKSQIVSEASIPEQLADKMETVISDDTENNKSETVSNAHVPEQLADKMETVISDDTANDKSQIVSEAHIPAQLADKMDVASSDDAENNKSETASNAYVPEQLADKMETSASPITAKTDETSCDVHVIELKIKNSDDTNDNLKAQDEHGSSETSHTVVHKHVKVAISHDLDVFITDVPFNDLSGDDQEDLTHDRVQDFLLGLKVAEFIADIDSLCHIFSVSPPHFVQSFLFRVQVVVQEDKSKYFKVSEPLPHGKVTAESVKQSVLSEMLIKSCRRIDFGHESDANIAFMQYMDDCGAQLIDKSNSNTDVKTQLQDFIEPLKFTSYLPWKNLNSKSLDSAMYSMFSVLDTNVIVHSKQPFMVNFEDSFEKAVILVKPQYCYEYGLEDITNAEYAALYLKTLLLDCVGAVVFHVDMKTFNIIHVDKLYLEELSELFPRAEAVNRLTSFFELLHTLHEGTHVYSHEVGQAHGVLYEELQSEHIQADLILNRDVSMELCNFVSPVKLSRTKLTSWQRHNVRLPMCFMPRKNGTYLCHEYLSRESCSKMATCAFAHLNKRQLECELGAAGYANFIEHFEKPKESKLANQTESNKVKNPNFGKILHKKHRNRKRGNHSQRKNP